MEQLNEKSKVGTLIDGIFVKVGRQLKDHLSTVKRIKVPTLNFSIKMFIKDFWDALWVGRVLPFRFRIDGEIVKETLWARLSFAAFYIIADSIYLVGRSGLWIIKKTPWKRLNLVNLVLVGGCVVGFLGWVFPWFLDQMGFLPEVTTTKTIVVVNDLIKNMPVPQVELPFKWVVLPWLVGSTVALPFSIARFRKWNGFKSVLRKNGKGMLENEIKGNS